MRQTSLAMQRWRRSADGVIDAERERDAARSLHHSRTFAGIGELKGHFDPDSNELVTTALRTAMTDDAEGEFRTLAERRADAFVDICWYFLDHQSVRLGRRHRPHVNVVMDLDDLGAGLGRTLDGTLLDPAAVKTLLCDCNVHRVLVGGSTIIDFGRAARTISAALFTALALRDAHCRHPGCEMPPRYCEGHHVVPWETGGPTRLDNLVLKCSRHHHLGHKPGWSEKLRGDGTLEITAPDGRCWVTAPPGTLAESTSHTLAA